MLTRASLAGLMGVCVLLASPVMAETSFAEGAAGDRGVGVVAGVKDATPEPRAPGSSQQHKMNGSVSSASAGRPKIGAGLTELATSTTDDNRRLGIFIPECWDGMVEKAECRAAPPVAAPTAPQQPAAPQPAPPTRAQAEALARTLVGRLDLPESTPLIGPDPSVNEWDMAVVGYPLWLWVDGDATMSSQVSGYGITITLDARRIKTVFSMGDGKSVTCARMSAYSKGVKPAAPSPTCGYTYSWPSLPKGSYRVTAASSWVVDWTALGYSGSIPITVTGERDLAVGELHSLNKAP